MSDPADQEAAHTANIERQHAANLRECVGSIDAAVEAMDTVLECLASVKSWMGAPYTHDEIIAAIEMKEAIENLKHKED